MRLSFADEFHLHDDCLLLLLIIIITIITPRRHLHRALLLALLLAMSSVSPSACANLLRAAPPRLSDHLQLLSNSPSRICASCCPLSCLPTSLSENVRDNESFLQQAHIGRTALLARTFSHFLIRFSHFLILFGASKTNSQPAQMYFTDF